MIVHIVTPTISIKCMEMYPMGDLVLFFRRSNKQILGGSFGFES